MPPFAPGYIPRNTTGEGDSEENEYSDWDPATEVEPLDEPGGSEENEYSDWEPATQVEPPSGQSASNSTPRSPSKGGRKRSYSLLDSQINDELQKELDGMADYLKTEKSTSLARGRAKGEKTVSKYVERIKGYLGWYLNISGRLLQGARLSMELLLDADGVLEFAFDFQRKERGNTAATVVQFFVAISSALRFVLEVLKQEPDYESNPVYQICVARRREQDREANKQRKTEANLRLEPSEGGRGRVTWEVFLNLALELLEDYKDHVERADSGQHRLLMNLIFCLLTAALLPGRGQESRLLEVKDSRPDNAWVGNCLYPKGGTYIFRWAIFKNVGDTGTTETKLPEDFPHLLPLLRKYLLRSLPCLRFQRAGTADKKYLFLDSNGNPFATAAAWTTYLNRFFESRLDIAGVSNTALRRVRGGSLSLSLSLSRSHFLIFSLSSYPSPTNKVNTIHY